MNWKTLSAIATGIAGLAFGLGIAVGQQPAPTENKGLKVGPPTALDLSQEMDSVQGRQLRLRVITLEPGGVVAVHSHGNRSQSAGQTCVADGTPLAAAKLAAVLDGDTGIGVVRHAEAGYDKAIEARRKAGLELKPAAA